MLLRLWLESGQPKQAIADEGSDIQGFDLLYDYAEGGNGLYDPQVDSLYRIFVHKDDSSNIQELKTNKIDIEVIEQSGVPVVGDFDGTRWQVITDTDTGISYILNMAKDDVIQGSDPFKKLSLTSGTQEFSLQAKGRSCELEIDPDPLITLEGDNPVYLAEGETVRVAKVGDTYFLPKIDREIP